MFNLILARGGFFSGQFWTETGIDIILLLDRFLMRIVANLFNIADAFYGVFATLAGATDIFDESIYGRITSGLYAIFGVAVLFILAYNFLLIIIDPDKSSGELSVGKTLIQIAVTLLMIVLLKPIFSIANGITGSIIEQNTIAQIIFGTGDMDQNCISIDNSEERIKCYDDYYKSKEKTSMCEDEPNGDSRLSCYDNESIMTGKNSGVSPMRAVLIDIFAFFISPDENVNPGSDGIIDNNDVYLHTMDRNGGPYASDWVKCPNGMDQCTLAQVISAAKQKGKYSYLFAFASNYHHASNDKVDGVEFHFFLGVVSAIYIIYILVLFSFDLAVRVIKIGFYQIVAPLCIACRIMPGPKKEIYKKWKSLTIKEYCLVFIRVFALCLGIFIISLLGTLLRRVTYPGYCGLFCQLMVKLFLILGILTFVKQMPKVIDDLLGGDTGLTSTVKDKLKDAAAGAKSLASLPLGAGAAGVAGAKGLKRGIDRFKKKKAANEKAKQKKEKAAKDLLDAEKTGNKDAINAARAKMAKATKASKRARRSMLSSFAGIGAGTLSSMGRSVSRSTGLSEAISDVTKDFKNARTNAESSANAAMSAAKRRDSRVRNFQDWMDKHGEYKKAGGYKAWKQKQDEMEKKRKELEVAMDEMADTIDAAKVNFENKKRELAAAEVTVTNGEEKKKEAIKKVEAAKAEFDKSDGKVTAATAELDSLTRQRAELEATVMNYPPGAGRDQVLANMANLDTQIIAANERVQQATAERTSLQTNVDTANSEIATIESELAAATSQRDALKAQADAASAELNTALDCNGLRTAFEKAKSDFNVIDNLRKSSADADLVIKDLVQNLSGSGAGAIETESKIVTILDEVDKGVIDSYKKVVEKHGREIRVQLGDAAEKVFNKGSEAAEIMTELSLDPAVPGQSRTKEEFSNILSSLQRAMNDEQFAATLEQNGIKVENISSITKLRETIQGQLTGFITREEKNEAGFFYDEILEFDRTGSTSGRYGGVIDSARSTTEFAGALTAAKDKRSTYSAMDPSLSSATSEELKDAHDERETHLNEIKQANATGVGADKMRNVISGNDERKS